MLLALAGVATNAGAQTTATYVTLSSATNPQTGNPVSASATFTILGGGALQIDISDNSVWSYNRADLLGAVLFNFAPSVTVTTAEGASNVTTSLISGSTVVNSNPASTASSQVVNGSWVFGDQNTPTPDPNNVYRYGVAGAGMSNPTVTAGAADGKESYAFSGFTTGNGGDDYLVIPQSATPNAQGRYLNGGNVELIKGPISVKITTGLTGLTSTSQITGVGFVFASGANPSTETYNTITGQPFAFPEPSSFGLIGGLLLTGAGAMIRRRKRG